jgi:hypothetical protein
MDGGKRFPEMDLDLRELVLVVGESLLRMKRMVEHG